MTPSATRRAASPQASPARSPRSRPAPGATLAVPAFQAIWCSTDGRGGPLSKATRPARWASLSRARPGRTMRPRRPAGARRWCGQHPSSHPSTLDNFAVQLAAALRAGRLFRAAADCVSSPTYVPRSGRCASRKPAPDGASDRRTATSPMRAPPAPVGPRPGPARISPHQHTRGPHQPAKADLGIWVIRQARSASPDATT